MMRLCCSAVALVMALLPGVTGGDQTMPPLVDAIAPLPDHGPAIVDSVLPLSNPFDELQVRCLARNAYHEARGEPDVRLAYLAVVFVVLNRVDHPAFPERPCDVVHQPRQFSWVRAFPPVDEWDRFELAVEVSEEALSGSVEDPTGGATHFHAVGHSPDWARRLSRVARIGSHVFYR